MRKLGFLTLNESRKLPQLLDQIMGSYLSSDTPEACTAHPGVVLTPVFLHKPAAEWNRHAHAGLEQCAVPPVLSALTCLRKLLPMLSCLGLIRILFCPDSEMSLFSASLLSKCPPNRPQQPTSPTLQNN